MDTHQCADAVGVLLVQLQSAFAFDAVVYTGLLHFEAGGIDQQVDFVFNTIEDWALGPDLGDALAFGVNQIHVRTVERWQIIVVETWPLTHKHVPRLERLGGVWILDGFVDALVDAHHCIDVRVLLAPDLLFLGDALEILSLFGLVSELVNDLLTPLALPSMLEFLGPGRIGFPVITNIDR